MECGAGGFAAGAGGERVNWRKAVLCVLMLPAAVLVAAMVMFLLEVGTRG